MTSTRLPAHASRSAQTEPANPAPTTRTSYLSLISFSSGQGNSEDRQIAPPEDQRHHHRDEQFGSRHRNRRARRAKQTREHKQGHHIDGTRYQEYPRNQPIHSHGKHGLHTKYVGQPDQKRQNGEPAQYADGFLVVRTVQQPYHRRRQHEQEQRQRKGRGTLDPQHFTNQRKGRSVRFLHQARDAWIHGL